MAFGTSTVARRDVEFNVNLGQFRAQLGEADAAYKRVTGGMSNDALRLSVKQYDLNKAVERFGVDSVQAARKASALKAEMTALTGASERHTGALLAEERALGRFTRGALAAGGASSELKRALLLGSGSFLLGVGLISGLKRAVDAAKEQQVANGQLQVSLKNSGLSWKAYGSQVEEALNAQVRATGFNKDELTKVLATNVLRFGDVNTALKYNALAADVARQKNISLADAQNLLQRLSFGNARSARQLGIVYTASTANLDKLKETTKHATAEQVAAAKAADLHANKLGLLAAAQERYGGSAAKFLTTSAGKQAHFNSELKLSEEIIGNALLPTIDHYLTKLADWLDKMNRSGQLQRDVNHAMKDAKDVIDGVKDAFHALAGPLKTANHLLGGTKHSVELLTAAFVLMKLGVLPSLFGAVAASIKGVGGAAVVSTGEVAALEGELAGLSAAAPIVIPITLAVAGAVGLDKLTQWAGQGTSGSFAGPGGGANPGAGPDAAGNQPGDVEWWAKKAAELSPNHKNPQYWRTHGAAAAVLLKQHGIWHPPGMTDAQARKAGYAATVTPSIVDTAPTGPNAFGPTAGGGKGGAGGDYKPTGVQALDLAIAQAQASGNTAQIRAAAAAKLAYDVKAAAFAQGRINAGKGTPSLVQQLEQVLGDEASQRGTIDSIDQAAASAAKQKADEAARKAAEAVRKRREAADKLFRHHESLLKADLQTAKNGGHTERIKAAVNKLEAFYKREEKDSTLSQAVRDLARTREVALHKQAYTIASALTHHESALKLAVEKAKLTDPIADDLKALTALEAFYKRKANDPRLTQKLRDTYAAKDIAERILIKKLKKGQTAAGNQDESQFLSTFATIVQSYAPNAFPQGQGKATTHLYEAVHELRGIKKHLATVVTHGKFPASKFADQSAAAVTG